MSPDYPPRRRHERYACRLTARIKASGSSKLLEGEIINISMGGGYLRLRGSAGALGNNPRGQLPPKDVLGGAGNTLQLEVEFEGERLALKAAVVRAGSKDAKNPELEVYGIAFLADAKTQNRLRQMIDCLRTLQGGPDMKTPNYWKL